MGVNWTFERPPVAGIVGHNDAARLNRAGQGQHRALVAIGGAIIAALPLQGRQECCVGNCPQLTFDFLCIGVLCEKLDQSIKC